MRPKKAVERIKALRGGTCTALVTGATSGMGLEYARQLAALGCDVLIVSNQEERLEPVATELHDQFGVRTYFLYKDLASTTAAQEVFDYCRQNDLEINILVNNAGMFFFEEQSEQNFAKGEKMRLLHIETPTRLTLFFSEEMKKRRCGYILNMSSMAAKIPAPGLTFYAATKAYLRSFTKSMFFELKHYDVGITAVCPGAVATPLYNLSEQKQKLAVRLGVMRTPRRLVKSALRALFCKRRCVTPGFINHIAPGVVNALPHWCVMKLWRKFK
ncbi:MAG: SDR family NAD(P)-dependent oxidoreductase [Bacteroidales bacterium]|nr:SDR family NAD(P)-dependent oxidoreductase [Bacteroidales bacterium]